MDQINSFRKKCIIIGGSLVIAYSLFQLNKDRIDDYVTYFLISRIRKFNKKHRPNRIILIRHGESEANIDHKVYSTTPDNLIQLTEKGKHQAINIGQQLKKIINDEGIQFFVSPYQRTIQTLDGISSNFDRSQFSVIIDPRIREQEWGNLAPLDENQLEIRKQERKKVGKFFFRFGYGESGADVYDRMSLFLSSLFRKMDETELEDRKKRQNYVIVSHGITMCIFLMRYFKQTKLEMETRANPQNCELWILEKNQKGHYKMSNQLLPDLD